MKSTWSRHNTRKAIMMLRHKTPQTIHGKYEVEYEYYNIIYSMTREITMLSYQ